MSTLATAELESEDEDDLDFQLPVTKPGNTRKRRRSGSDPSSESSESEKEDGIDVAEAAKLRADQAAAEAEERRKKAEEAFRAMKSQSSTVAAATGNERLAAREMVTVQRARQFAGETILESVQLPVDDPEAIAYSQGRVTELATDDTSHENTQDLHGAAPVSSEAVAGPSKTTMQHKKPVRRKPRQSLEAMSAALDKGKKMTTLEKSQLDWKSHTGGDKTINDELEANRRAGGYLQKKDFLERVGERRMGTFDSMEEVRKRQR